MTEKKIEQLKDGDAAPKTGEHAKKAGVIGDQKNQETHGKAFQKTHERDKRPSELELPVVESFGIKGDVQPGDTGKGRGGVKEPLRVRDDSWRPEAGALRWQAFGEGVQALVGSDHEKAVLARRHFLKVLNDHEQDDSVKENMTKALQQFEGRFQSNPKEVKAFYEELSKLVDTQDLLNMRPIAQGDRTKLAEQVILQAANPDLVRQGNHDSCNVATVEHRMYSRHPAAAAHVVSSLALDGGGNFGGSEFHISKPLYPEVYKAEKGSADLHLGDKRSFASQLFQIGAVNVHYAEASNYQYVQVKPEFTSDTGERLLTKEGAYEGRKPALSDDELVKIYNKIAGTKEEGFVMVHKSEDRSTKHCTVFETVGDLRDYLGKHQTDMPLILVVHTANEPFWSDGESPDEIGGLHVITLKSFDAKTNTVSIHNQWSPEDDHSAIPLEQIYRAARSPAENILSMQRRIENNDKLSVDEKLDLARLKWRHMPVQNGDQELSRELVACMKEAQSQWRAEQKSQAEQDRSWIKYNKILQMLSSQPNGKQLVKEVRREVGR